MAYPIGNTIEPISFALEVAGSNGRTVPEYALYDAGAVRWGFIEWPFGYIWYRNWPIIFCAPGNTLSWIWIQGPTCWRTWAPVAAA